MKPGLTSTTIRRLTYCALGAGLVLVALSIGLDDQQRTVAYPALAVILVLATLVAVLSGRDHAIPYFDIGVVCTFVTAVYLAFPPLAFLLSGLEWTVLSDGRLLRYQVSPPEFSAITWWGALYIFSLASTYSVTRQRPAADFTVRLREPSKAAIVGLVFFFALVLIYSQMLQSVLGVNLNPTYGSEDLTIDSESVPLLLQQITDKVLGIGVVLQFGLILLLVNRAHNHVFRWTLYIWAGALTVTLLTTFGARSQLAFFLLAWLLAHERLRPRFGVPKAVVFGILLVLALLFYGFARDMRDASVEPHLIFSAITDFQALYGTTYEVMRIRDTVASADLPLTLYLADFFRLFPQQILPFEKVDPAGWYLDTAGLRGLGGYNFGVLSEAAIGLGAIELVARGMVLGFLLGYIHNWYVKRAAGFWPTLFYLWLCVLSYYTFRASTFYLLTHALYVFLPAYLLVTIASSVLTWKQRTLKSGQRDNGAGLTFPVSEKLHKG